MNTPLLLSRRWVVVLVLLGLPASAARSQNTEPLRLDGLIPSGARGSVTESWGTLRVDLTNLGPEGRDARVVAFYPERANIQYTRDIFVPGHSSVSSWLTIGPAPEQRGQIHRNVEILLYDRTGGQERRVRFAAGGDEKVRSQPVFYRRREPTIAVIPPDADFDRAVVAGQDDPESVVLARSLRDAAVLSESVMQISERFLPPLPEALDGIDVLVLASNRLASDPAARQVLRRWVQQGGTLWVLLDQVAPATIAPLLGDELNIQAIDRVGLTSLRLHRIAEDPANVVPREFDRPVEMVRVVVTGADSVLHTANGFPASFVRGIGRGHVLFTTLGARGWYRPRTARDPRPRYEHFPDQPLPHAALADLAVRFHPRESPPAMPTDTLRDVLMHEVGYSVVGRGTAAALFGAFVVGLLGVGLGLRFTRRPELLGWLAPAVAIGTAAVFLAIGEASRGSVPPTVGIAEVVDAVPGSREAAASGVFAIYRPNSGPVPFETDTGAMLDLDKSGLDGQTRQRVVTDLDAWHWEHLNLPAGIRTGSFRSTIRPARLSAVARFGPNGLDGQLALAPFRNPTDGLVLSSARTSLPIRFGEGNTFSARVEDALPPGQYLSAAVLSDRQQRRQAVYRQLLGKSLPKHWEGRDLLLTWADPDRLPFRVESSDRVVGTALLAIPLEFDRPPPNTAVTIPQAFIPYSRMLLGYPRLPQLEGSIGIEMEVRFQLPPSVLPLSIERAKLVAKVRTPNRRFTISGHGDTGLAPVFDAENPIETIQLEIVDPRLLRLDPDGGLHLTVKIGEQPRSPAAGKTPPGQPGAKGQFKGKGPQGGAATDGVGPVFEATPDSQWKIESLGLEVVGRTAAK